jgi:hypothetical protein
MYRYPLPIKHNDLESSFLSYTYTEYEIQGMDIRYSWIGKNRKNIVFDLLQRLRTLPSNKTPCSPLRVIDVSEEHIAPIYRVEISRTRDQSESGQLAEYAFYLFSR